MSRYGSRHGVIFVSLPLSFPLALSCSLVFLLSCFSQPKHWSEKYRYISTNMSRAAAAHVIETPCYPETMLLNYRETMLSRNTMKRSTKQTNATLRPASCIEYKRSELVATSRQQCSLVGHRDYQVLRSTLIVLHTWYKYSTPNASGCIRRTIDHTNRGSSTSVKRYKT